MYICSFQCHDIIFDYHDSERVLIRNEYPYYITPSKLAKIEAWIISENIYKIKEKAQLDFLIDKKWIASYAV